MENIYPKRNPKKQERSGIAHLIPKVKSWKFFTYTSGTSRATYNFLKRFFAVLQNTFNSIATWHRLKGEQCAVIEGNLS